MLVADVGTAMAYVDVERSVARKVTYNARGATKDGVISTLLF